MTKQNFIAHDSSQGPTLLKSHGVNWQIGSSAASKKREREEEG